MSQENTDNNSQSSELEGSSLQGAHEVILDTAKTIYNEESERFKQVEAKTNITLAFVGVLFAAYLTYLGSYKPIIKDSSYLVYTLLFKLAVFVCFTLSISFFLRSVRTGEYDQVDLDNIVTRELAEASEQEVKLQIAATYKEAIDNNKAMLESKMKEYSLGLNLMFWGFIVFAVHFIIEEVIKYVH